MPNAYYGPERRRAPRVMAGFMVRYEIVGPLEVRIMVGNREINAVMLDLSNIGMAILTEYDIPLISTLWTRFSLINPYAYKDGQVRPMEIIGEVRNNQLLERNEHRLGLFFKRIAQEDKYAIDEFVKTQLSK